MKPACTLLAAVALAGITAASARASCLPLTPQQQRARAKVIFDGVALDNPTGTGVQRFRVTRYLKGHGPGVVRVSTGFVKRADGTDSITSVSLIVHRGEHWRIYGRGNSTRTISSTSCDGSHKR